MQTAADKRVALSLPRQYQSAQLMASKGVNVPYGIAVKSVDEAVAAAAKIGDDEVVIKSQILAGGRGLGTFTNGFKGGVHVIKTSQATRSHPQRDTLHSTLHLPNARKTTHLDEAVASANGTTSAGNDEAVGAPLTESVTEDVFTAAFV